MAYSINGKKYDADDLYQVDMGNGTWNLRLVDGDNVLDNVVMKLPGVEVR